MVRSVAVSDDGQTIVSGGTDGRVVRWSLHGAPFSPALVDASSTGTGASVAVSPDGQTIVGGSERGMLRLWTGKGELIREFRGHTEDVSVIAFSPDGKTIVSAGGEFGESSDTLRLWDLQGKPSGQIKTHGTINSLALSSDRKMLVSGGVTGRIVVHRIVSIDGFLQEACDWLRHHVLAISDEAVGTTFLTYGGWSKDQKAEFLVRQGRRAAGRGTKRDVERAIGAFRSALQLDHEVDLDPDSSAQDQDPEAVARQLATRVVNEKLEVSTREKAKQKLDEGRGLAQKGDVKGAITAFRAAQRLDPDLELDPDTSTPAKDATVVALQFAIAGAESRATDGKVPEAVVIYREAQKIDSEVDLDPSTGAVDTDPVAVARRKSALGKLAQGTIFAEGGSVDDALRAYKRAQEIDPSLQINAEDWNQLGWYGSLHGRAADVMFACEKAVELEPEDGNLRDTRGLARALTGNTAGAIEDFKAFIATVEGREDMQPFKAKRQQWVTALQNGGKPFTKQLLSELESESD